MYNHLEFALFCLTLDYAGLTNKTTQWLFANTSNNTRLDLLKRSVTEKEANPSVKDSVLHFADCFDICAENRNILMHSMVNKAEDAAILNFAKASRNDPSRVNTLNLRLEDIRRTADEIATVYSYGTRLHTYFITNNSTLTPEFYKIPEDMQTWLRALPNKPALPSKLSKPNPPTPKAG